MTKSKHNITDSFELAFLLGFLVLAIDFINSSFIMIYFRLKADRQQRDYGSSSSFTRFMTRAAIVMHYTIRFFMGIVVFYQVAIVHSKQGDYCVKKLGVLKQEAHWLDILIVLQGIKSVLFTIWEFQSIDAQKDEETFQN